MQSRVYIEVNPVPSKAVRYIYYLSHLVFDKDGEKENAAICLDRAKCTKTAGIDFPDQVVQARTAGWQLKASKETEKAKVVFATAVSEGDPISQYELALLLGFADPQAEELLKAASPHLIQAKVALYQLYVGKSDYDNGYKALYNLVEFMVGMTPFSKIEMHISAIPSLRKIVQRSNEINYGIVSHFTIPGVLAECALAAQDKKESLELHNLAASQGNAESIIFLVTYNKEELLQRQKECTTLQAMISSGKNGDAKLTEQLIQQAKIADTNTLVALFEQARDSREIYHVQDNYSFKIVEAASNSHPITSCLLSIMCYHAIGAKQDVKKSQDILKQVQLDVTKFAEGGNIMAQWELGVVIKDRWDYYGSLKWLSKSASHMLLALHTLGDSYLKGYYDGVRGRNYPAEARLCYEKCAEFGYVPSQMRLESLGWTDKKSGNGVVEETKTNVQTQRGKEEVQLKACYGVMYDNAVLNMPDFAELANVARREALVMSNSHVVNGVDRLLEVGANPQEWNVFKMLRETVGDVGAVRWALRHEHDRNQNSSAQALCANDAQVNAGEEGQVRPPYVPHEYALSVPITLDDSVRDEKLHAQVAWFVRTGEVLQTLGNAMAHGVVRAMELPNMLDVEAYGVSGQNEADNAHTQEQEDDTQSMLHADLTREAHKFADPKVAAQWEWYLQTGEVLPTLQKVVDGVEHTGIPMDALVDPTSKHGGHYTAEHVTAHTADTEHTYLNAQSLAGYACAFFLYVATHPQHSSIMHFGE